MAERVAAPFNNRTPSKSLILTGRAYPPAIDKPRHRPPADPYVCKTALMIEQRASATEPMVPASDRWRAKAASP
jgi:hypothetical protein